MGTAATLPTEQDALAAITGMRMALTQKRWWGIKPSGKAGANIQAEQIRTTGRPLDQDIADAIARAQTRWPEATAWQLIGADTDQWANLQTFAEFNWPLKQ